MKQYKKFYREAKGDLPRIYCDMDGVLCDFVLAAKRATGQNWLGLRSGQDWESIKRTKNFWSTMPWTGDGRRLWNFIKKYTRISFIYCIFSNTLNLINKLTNSTKRW